MRRPVPVRRPVPPCRRNPEVRHDREAIVIEEDVVRLDVAVHDTLAVGVVECAGHLCRGRRSKGRGHRPLPHQPIGERATAQKRHDAGRPASVVSHSPRSDK